MVLILTECLKWSSFSQSVAETFVYCIVHITHPNATIQCSVTDLNGVTENNQIKYELRK